ncbi:hypothetical protein TNCV_4278721, partial [Trichonephila clavipes]
KQSVLQAMTKRVLFSASFRSQCVVRSRSLVSSPESKSKILVREAG